jgi:hypothetical protein
MITTTTRLLVPSKLEFARDEIYMRLKIEIETKVKNKREKKDNEKIKQKKIKDNKKIQTQ